MFSPVYLNRYAKFSSEKKRKREKRQEKGSEGSVKSITVEERILVRCISSHNDV